MHEQNMKVAIIGGGMTGLAAAWKLEKEIAAGTEVSYDLFEKGEKLGGKIQTELVNEFVIERGPDSFLARKESMSRLAKDVGMEADLLPNNTGQAYILKDDQLHPIPAGAVMGVPTEMKPFLESKLISPKGKVRAAGDLFLPNKTSKDEDISLGHFFRLRLGDEVVDHLIEPLLSGIYAGNLDKLSLKATFPMYQQMVEKEGGLIRGMKKSRAKQPKPKTGKAKGVFLTFRKGLGSFVNAIESHLNSKHVHKNTDITSIEKEGKRYRIHFKDKESQLYDQVIITTPPHVTAELLKDFPYFHYLKEMEATSVANVALAFKEGAVHNPYEGTGFVVPSKSRYTITACTWTDKKWHHSTPEGYTLLRLYVGKPDDSEIVHKSDEEIVKAAMHDLKQIMTITGEPEFYRVTRWKKAMPQYNVGHSYKIAKIKEDVLRNLPGIHLCGAGFEGVGLPDCIDQGEAAVKRILKDLH
ncbi:protoporphyrinogen oxidase [bacterium LRH843]|nr:protoporphyrinogen oxidase [bacterium LRH843]